MLCCSSLLMPFYPTYRLALVYLLASILQGDIVRQTAIDDLLDP